MSDLLPAFGELLIFIAGLVLLVKGADWFVEGAASIARRLGVSKLVVGLTIVAIGTSAPEFAVSGYAALNGSGELALANVVGSNIFNLGFILAFCSILTPMAVSRQTVYRDCFFLIVGTLLVSFLVLYDGVVSRFDGSLLIVSLAGYISYLLWLSKKSIKEAASQEIVRANGHWSWEVAKVLFGLSGLLVGCNLVVETAKSFALSMGMSEWFIGITIIAMGTSLPELVTAVASVLKKDSELGIGGLIGSDIFNLFGVVGFTAVLSPMSVGNESAVPFFFLIFATCLTAFFLRTHWRLSRIEGIVLLGVATFRYAYEIF